MVCNAAISPNSNATTDASGNVTTGATVLSNVTTNVTAGNNTTTAAANVTTSAAAINTNDTTIASDSNNATTTTGNETTTTAAPTTTTLKPILLDTNIGCYCPGTSELKEDKFPIEDIKEILKAVNERRRQEQQSFEAGFRHFYQ